MKVCIVGAGAAGLASARHVSGQGIECEVLEMAPELGGTWVYTDEVGEDQFGFPVYSAMYKGLRTNLPKEVMGFPDFPIPEQSKSYLSQAEILEFLNLYVDHFNLRQFIKFNRMITSIHPDPSTTRWHVTSTHKPTNLTTTATYDAVMVCNGHYAHPITPPLPGLHLFKGRVQHSRDYRSPAPFHAQRILVIGAGPSGLDLALQLSKVAAHVVLSRRGDASAGHVEVKPEVKQFLGEEEVEFVDGSKGKFDVVLLCTGYMYSFPFLDEKCGIRVEENHIKGLYKHLVNVERPTMGLIGIPFNVCAFQMFDLQARFFVQYLNGSMQLPSKEEMILDTKRDMQNRWAKGYTKSQAHMMGPDQQHYYEDLAKAANTTPIAPVIVKLRDESVKRLYDDLENFREDRYKIVNIETFVKVQ